MNCFPRQKLRKLGKDGGAVLGWAFDPEELSGFFSSPKGLHRIPNCLPTDLVPVTLCLSLKVQKGGLGL